MRYVAESGGAMLAGVPHDDDAGLPGGSARDGEKVRNVGMALRMAGGTIGLRAGVEGAELGSVEEVARELGASRFRRPDILRGPGASIPRERAVGDVAECG